MEDAHHLHHKAHDLAFKIKIVAALMAIGGIINIIMAFATLDLALTWFNLTTGILLLIIAGRGWHAAVRHCERDARQYYYGLITLTVIYVVLWVIYLIVFLSSSVYDNWCYDENWEHSKCSDFKIQLIFSSAVSLVITLLYCACYLWCAREYLHVLHQENALDNMSGGYNQGYQAVPPQSYQVQPPSYPQNYQTQTPSYPQNYQTQTPSYPQNYQTQPPSYQG